MKKASKIYLFLIVIIAFVILTVLSIKLSKKEDTNFNEDYETAYSNMKNNSIMYKNNATLQELKEEYKYNGNDELYQIENEYDGRKVITVKANVNYNVAFAGLIKKDKPEFYEINNIIKDNYPKENGIWIEDNSREKILNYLNNREELKAEYNIDDKGYLRIKIDNDKSENDKKIEKLINGKKQYLFAISGLNYMVDAVTGTIIKNPYEDLSDDQPYDYFEDDNKMIIFITENIEKKLTEDEIFESILDLI